MNQETARAIFERRDLVDKEPQKLRTKRFRWLNWLRVEFDFDDLQFMEMYRFVKFGTIKSKKDYPQFDSQSLYRNTRNKLPSETCFEIDSLSPKEAVGVICEICLSLIRQNYHFCVFWAEGSRSPHIRIYDFEELKDLDSFFRERAEIEFWKSVAPMLWKYGDKSLFSANHPLQLEFSLHWKHKTPFDLLFEYLPNKSGVKNATLEHFYN